MSAFTFAEGFGMMDITPVENLFIEEYMLRAPGDYVKVYIYGLRLCYHPEKSASPASVARALGMDEGAVLDALSYWERQRIVRRVADNPPAFCFINVKQALSGGLLEDADTAEYRAFVRSMQALFENKVLQSHEISRINEWVEAMGLGQEAVLLLIRHCMEEKGKNVSLSYMEKVAVTWAKEGVNSYEAADEYLRRRGAAHKAAQGVLKQLRLRRLPTMDEEALAASWLSLGFTPDAILCACREMNKISAPNFAYLDKVLQSLAQRGAFTPRAVEASLMEREELAARVKALLKALGMADGALSDDVKSRYLAYISRGFEHDALLAAARHTLWQGRSTLERLEAALPRFEEERAFTADAIEAHMRAQGEHKNAARAFLKAAGLTGAPTNADAEFMRRWAEAGMPHEVICCAGECARGAHNARMYAERVLAAWREAGVTTLEEARARRASGAAQGGAAESGKRLSKNVAEQNYSQREYTDEQLSSLSRNLATDDWEEA